MAVVFDEVEATVEPEALAPAEGSEPEESQPKGPELEKLRLRLRLLLERQARVHAD